MRELEWAHLYPPGADSELNPGIVGSACGAEGRHSAGEGSGALLADHR